MRTSYIAALAAVVIGVGTLAIMGFSQDTAYFVDVAEAKAIPAGKLQGARLFGTVAERGFTKSDDGRSTAFLLEDRQDKANVMPVRFTGVLPDAFRIGAEVIVEGDMGAGSFDARSVMTKCPSKYQKENRKG